MIIGSVLPAVKGVKVTATLIKSNIEHLTTLNTETDSNGTFKYIYIYIH